MVWRAQNACPSKKMIWSFDQCNIAEQNTYIRLWTWKLSKCIKSGLKAGVWYIRVTFDVSLGFSSLRIPEFDVTIPSRWDDESSSWVWGTRSHFTVMSLQHRDPGKKLFFKDNSFQHKECVAVLIGLYKNEATWRWCEPTCLSLGPVIWPWPMWPLTLTHVTFDLDAWTKYAKSMKIAFLACDLDLWPWP